MVKRGLIFLIVPAILALSCGKPAGGLVDGDRSVNAPRLVVVEKVIAGEILKVTLSNPYGLAVDQRDHVYVVDAGNNRLVQFTLDLTPVSDIGGYGEEAGLLDRPSFLTFDNGLNLMVSNEGNRRVSRYNSQLNFVDDLSFYDSDDPLKFGFPSGLAFTDYGEVWVADRDNNRIAVFSNTGKFDRFLGDIGYSGGQLNDPEKIVKSPAGEFIICDAGNRRLVFYDHYGNYSEEIDLSEFEYPKAIASSKGLVWILDSTEGVVACLDYEGELLYEVGPTIAGDRVALKNPSDLVVLSPDRLLISDSGNNRILVCRIVYSDN